MEMRELIIRIDGKGTDHGTASVLAYRLGSEIEIVTTEDGAGDAAVFLTEAQARALVHALAAALAGGHGNRAS